MALTTILRRSTSEIAPLAARFSGGPKNFHSFSTAAKSVAKTHFSDKVVILDSFSSLCHYSALPKKTSSDESLLKVIESEIVCAEEFLWRKNASFAISRHYKRFDVFIEAEANKAAAKYDNESIDFQAEFYRREGLTPYSESKLPITSDVPEGCVIIREHIPITNLFTCLWFNEVDRFTSRDQISFATVRDKISSKTNWTVSMFLDCERRNFVVQVAIIAPNTAARYEAHFEIPMSGAVVNTVNVRLNASATSFLLEHSSSAVVMADQEFFKLAEEALEILALHMELRLTY